MCFRTCCIRVPIYRSSVLKGLCDKNSLLGINAGSRSRSCPSPPHHDLTHGIVYDSVAAAGKPHLLSAFDGARWLGQSTGTAQRSSQQQRWGRLHRRHAMARPPRRTRPPSSTTRPRAPCRHPSRATTCLVRNCARDTPFHPPHHHHQHLDAQSLVACHDHVAAHQMGFRHSSTASLPLTRQGMISHLFNWHVEFLL